MRLTDYWATLLLAIAAWESFFLLRWKLGAGRLGPLILESKRPRPWLLWFEITASGLGFAGNFGLCFESGWRFTYVALAAWFAVFGVYLGWFQNRVQFRERGLVSSGAAFWRWSEVASYSWGPNPGKVETLRLHLTGRWRWLRCAMWVKPELRPQIDDLLNRRLALRSGDASDAS